MPFLSTRLQRTAQRTHRCSPSVAILALALGFGANSAMFNGVRGVLLKLVTFDHAEHLVTSGTPAAAGE